MTLSGIIKRMLLSRLLLLLLGHSLQQLPVLQGVRRGAVQRPGPIAVECIEYAWREKEALDWRRRRRRGSKAVEGEGTCERDKGVIT